MYRPFLFVGLGGSGGKTLRYLKKGTLAWLAEQGWDGDGVPAGWQFLHIDTPTIPDGKELNQFVPMLDASEYAGLVGEGVDYLAVSNALDNIEGMSQELQGWRIDPVALAVPIGEGAGQFRAIGRTVAMLQGRQIRQRLRNSFDRIKTPTARAQLGSLYSQVTGQPPAQGYPAPVVVVVSSLAGGTGAGLLMNVCDLIEELGESSASLALLYTPEVFGATPGAGGALNPNSLAAISEVLNGHWLHGAVDGGGAHVAVRPRNGRDLQFAGAAQSLSKSGPAYPFLIGLKNASGASFGTDRALFGMIGAALVSWLTDLRVQDKLIAYSKTNWENAARTNNPSPDVLVNIGKSSELGVPAFSALGVARLSLGLDHFEKYAAERMALDAAMWLSRAHAESDAAASIIASEGLRDPEVLAARIAERELSVFLLRAGLAEKGPKDDMVIDSLRPNDSELRNAARQAAEKMAELGTGGTASGQAWAEHRVLPAVRNAQRAYVESYVALLQEQCKEWVKVAPTRILEEVESIIASYGARVGAALVRATAKYFLEDGGVVQELIEEQLDREHWSADSKLTEMAFGTLQPLGAKVDNRHAGISRAIDDSLHYGLLIGEARLRQASANLLRSFAENFLKPLAAEIDAEAGVLDQALQGDAANWAPWIDGPPPAHLIPPLSEITLLEPARFSEVFNELLSETFPSEAEYQQRLTVRHEVTTGSFLRRDSAAPRNGSSTPAIHVREDWWPGNTVIFDALRSENRAGFVVSLRPEALKQRASEWMHRSNSPFQTFLSESLRTYLQRDTMFAGGSKPEQVYVERRREFIPKLQAAIAASAPLVNLDNGLVGTLHPQLADKPFLPILSPLPFKNHELEGDVRSVLLSELAGAGGEVEDLLTSDQLVKDINISSTLRYPCSPLVISSLLRPIAENWATVSQSNVQVQQFWLRRRARPLHEFIPAPQEHILAMTRGWFIGASLGIIERGVPVRIGRDNNIPAFFPKVTLSKSGEARDALPLILESLALAYVDVSNSGTLKPLDAYITLRDLGRFSLHDDRLLEFPEVGHIIEAWSDSGVAPGAIVEPMVSGADKAARLTALRDSLQKSMSGYAQDYDRLLDLWRKQPSKLGDPPLWPGIRWHISTALDQITTALAASIAQSQSGGFSAGPL